MKIQNIIQSLSVLLLLTLSLGMLTSCQLLYLRYEESSAAAGGTVGSSAETRNISGPPGTAPEFGTYPEDLDSGFAEAEAAVSALHAEDYTDFDFLVCTAEEANHTLLPAETDPLYVSYVRRNALLTDVYHNTLYCSEAPMAALQKDLAASVKAGSDAASYYADLLEVPAANACALSNAGLLLNLRSLPFYTVGTAGSTGAGFYRNTKNCFDTSRPSYSPLDVYCLYFNTTLLGKSLSESLYLSALDDSLTFEMLLLAAKEAEQPDAAYPICGNFPAGQFANLVFVRAGNRYTEPVSGNPQLSDILTASEPVDTLFASLNNLHWFGFLPEEPAISSSAIDSSATVPSKDHNGMEAFASGKALFYVGTVRDAEALASAPCRWGLLPLPKDVPNAENIEKNRSVLCVPANNTRLEMTGLLLTGLGEVTGSWIGKEYAAYATLHLLRDNASYYTLCQVFEAPSFCDFAELCGTGCKNLTAATYDAVAKAMETGVAVSSVTKPLQTAVNNALKKLN